ncbi:hypothetical protein IQ259_04260 [Fortiea sp. LEGE XX443]|uniref:hypothetical protein n=1 Tax=Fortiea sp. LEGE XX443 TaxID=1828611 RepID=UPI0019DF124B|nr:hypothetical protein [Fortiea sp. LEGE XX443]
MRQMRRLGSSLLPEGYEVKPNIYKVLRRWVEGRNPTYICSDHSSNWYQNLAWRSH